MSGNKCAIADGRQRGQLTTADDSTWLLPLLVCLLLREFPKGEEGEGAWPMGVKQADDVGWAMWISSEYLGVMGTFWMVSLFIFARPLKKKRARVKCLSRVDLMFCLDESKLGVAVVNGRWFFSMQWTLNFFTYSTNQLIVEDLTESSWTSWHHPLALKNWFHGPLRLVSSVRFWNWKIPYLDAWMVLKMANNWVFCPKAHPPAVAVTVIICIAGSDKVLTPGDVQRSGSSPEP